MSVSLKHCPFSPVPINCEMCELEKICKEEERLMDEELVAGVIFTEKGFEAKHIEFNTIPEEHREEFWTVVSDMLNELKRHIDNYLRSLKGGGSDDVL